MLSKRLVNFSLQLCKCLRYSSSSSTHFGFKDVSEEEKAKRVYQVFENVADRYDLMNDAMSLMVHRLWKDQFIWRLSPKPGIKVIDVAGGTGDIAFRIVDYIQLLANNGDVNSDTASSNDFDIVNPLDIDIMKELDSSDDLDFQKFTADNQSQSKKGGQLQGKAVVTISDINKHMLEVGKRRHKELYGRDVATCHPSVDVGWLVGDAEALPVDDESYDAYTIAFGIRNCTHVAKVVDEAYRVLRPGGRFMCLEFSRLDYPILSQLYESYSFQVIPVLGQVLAGDWRSYQYLVESIRKFPDQEEFKEIIEESGFKMVSYENLSFGIAAIHSGYKL